MRDRGPQGKMGGTGATGPQGVAASPRSALAVARAIRVFAATTAALLMLVVIAGGAGWLVLNKQQNELQASRAEARHALCSERVTERAILRDELHAEIVATSRLSDAELRQFFPGVPFERVKRLVEIGQERRTTARAALEKTSDFCGHEFVLPPRPQVP